MELDDKKKTLKLEMKLEIEKLMEMRKEKVEEISWKTEK